MNSCREIIVIQRACAIFMLMLMYAAACPSATFGQDKAAGTVELGSENNEAVITVTNTGPQVPIKNVKVGVTNQPRLITNMKIQIGIDALHPQSSRILTVRFDVLEDAVPGDNETITFQITADNAVNFDHPNPQLTVTIAPSSAAPSMVGRPPERDSPSAPSSSQSASVPSAASPARTAEESDYYLITVQGTGLFFGGSGSFERRKGSDDFIRGVKRGESVETLLASIRRSLTQPWCGGVRTRPVDVYEDYRVDATGPFVKYEEVLTRLRGENWKTIETVANVNPQELLRLSRCGGSGGTSPQGDRTATGPVTGVGSTVAGSTRVDPNSLNPNADDVSGFIQNWITMAEPPDNAKGASLRYDEWGRVHGTGVNREIITSVRRPDAAGGMSSSQYLWTLRDQLDSINHCTLGQFVMASLQNHSVNDCQGRYKKPPPQLLAVPDMAGRNWQAAQTDLQRAGFQVDLVGGDPAATKAEENSVQWQKPTPGTRVAPGSKIQIAVRSAYAEPRQPVPDIRGLAWGQAQERLRGAGFEAALVGGDPAPSEDRVGTVERQRPVGGESAPSGSRIEVALHTVYVAPRTDSRPAIPSAPVAPSPVTPPRAESPIAAPSVPPAEVQQAQQCNDLVNRGNAANGAGQFQEALNNYSQARQMSCNIPGLDNGIANMEGALQRQRQQQQQAQQCNNLMIRGIAANGTGQLQEALNNYLQARQLNCSTPGLDTTIASIRGALQRQQQQQQQAQQCSDLVNRGNAANGAGRFQDALNNYAQARQMNCNIPGLDNGIANVQAALQRQQQQAQQCNDLVNRGNAANGAGRFQDALNNYSHARQMNCNIPGLDQAIAGVENRLRQSQTKAVPAPANRPSFGTPAPAGRSCPPGQVLMSNSVLGQGDYECVVPRR